MRERLFKLLGAFILAGSLGLGWLLMSYQLFSEAPLSVGEEGVTFTISHGTPLIHVARELEQEGVVSDARMFVWMARIKGATQAIQAGEYHIAPGTTPPQLLEQMVAGKVVLYALTLVEGWNFRQVMEALNANPHLEHTLTGLSDEEIMQRLGHADEHPEGRFFPDTYHFPRGLSDATFLQRAYAAMAERLTAEWAQRAEGLPYASPYEALIMASIVEKETGLASERPAIAGVFVRRLQKGMRLQTDPTVIYGLGLDFDGNLRRRDLANETPYNTYRFKGLPPTPIAMPGGEALHAALHPQEDEALYFVAKGDGSHHFSATLAEHNRAVIKYQLKGRNRKFSSNP